MNEIKFRLKNIHFIGIGGSGMNGIAEVLLGIGYNITGSDLQKNANTLRLEKLGVKISYNHNENNIKNAETVVISSAIDKQNVELISAQKNKIPVVKRAQMLAEIMRFRFGIAISGTHGKTTTTSIIARIMTDANLDPTYIIGGVLNADGVSNNLGKSDYLVAEADESDGSFLKLNPTFSVITNIDKDHMQTYDFSEEKLQQAFIDFTDNLPFYGLCVACIDDIGVGKIIDKISRKIITYGIDNAADLMAKNIQYTKNGSNFDVIYSEIKFNVNLSIIGKHNILNCLAAIVICLELGVKTDVIQKSLMSCSGAKRRLDFKGDIQIADKKIKVFDDYGHHPSEIKAVVESMQKTFVDNKIVVIFQPHRYSRTKDLFDDFASELSKIETLILLPIYSANEAEISGINSTSLAGNIRSRSHNEVFAVKDFNECESVLENILEDGNIVLTLGAGNVVEIADSLLNKY
jgi:UDP-N-acetylmuramate--alanine ligase